MKKRLDLHAGRSLRGCTQVCESILKLSNAPQGCLIKLTQIHGVHLTGQQLNTLPVSNRDVDNDVIGTRRDRRAVDGNAVYPLLVAGYPDCRSFGKSGVEARGDQRSGTQESRVQHVPGRSDQWLSV